MGCATARPPAPEAAHVVTFSESASSMAEASRSSSESPSPRPARCRNASCTRAAISKGGCACDSPSGRSAWRRLASADSEASAAAPRSNNRAQSVFSASWLLARHGTPPCGKPSKAISTACEHSSWPKPSSIHMAVVASRASPHVSGSSAGDLPSRRKNSSQPEDSSSSTSSPSSMGSSTTSKRLAEPALHCLSASSKTSVLAVHGLYE
mmetsp:Transcript_13168/g.37896  ORF Transcript_13168/g.37896 Transcript_13168/m.37896 type:complete len:209 (+) Transcript_13168:1321-1947(+)